jgi:hypothetical protein
VVLLFFGAVWVVLPLRLATRGSRVDPAA